jgi:hypothetical protein
MKDRFLLAVIVFGFVILVPYLVTLIVNGGGSGGKSLIDEVSTGKDVIITDSGKNYLVDVENFVSMCLPALISWDSEADLIQAQAVAVRSRVLYLMGDETVINADNLGYTYFTEQKLRDFVGSTSYFRVRKIYERAVYNTLGVTQ